jgi:hypothetical protein
MTITIYGHKLPPLLCQLIEDGKWKHPDDTDLMRELVGGIYDTSIAGLLSFLSTPSMERETMALKRLYNIDGEYTNSEGQILMRKIYGLSSSKLSGKPIPDHMLDIDNQVCIAVSYEEEGFNLDYRLDSENPRVVANFPREDRFIRWRVIAPDFETFARKLGLIE